jgi:hypothetical protein
MHRHIAQSGDNEQLELACSERTRRSRRLAATLLVGLEGLCAHARKRLPARVQADENQNHTLCNSKSMNDLAVRQQRWFEQNGIDLATDAGENRNRVSGK